MGLAISPYHVVFKDFPTPESWPLDFKIDVFLARVDGWHLQIADRCINGWQDNEGRQCITAPHHSFITHQIPDAGWAVLQIVMNYFEIIGLFKFFRHSEADDTFELFKQGVIDVFPEHESNKQTVKLLFALRNGLYHQGVRGNNLYISGNEPKPLDYDSEEGQLKINPHLFVRRLREHFAEYAQSLRDPTQTELRGKFKAAFYDYYAS
ncbi:MAG TPA: hypothetical protein PKD09_08930 [Aggregatilinea sp.]|uniref:hypothetical protein n=1 Tax=Aggregatilinea sp. TaxID=2806333 RepID=UPI002C314F76|nr:hypothetical protein [Aggregatilinea sp.]HML21758.1 hypothetical protein [Aggregatilinea sp.]